MAQIKVRNLDVFYRDQGQGQAVILGHSSTGSSGQWRSLIDSMSENYRMLAPDHIGYGRTPNYQGLYDLIEHETAIIQSIWQLVSEPVHMVGHSYGGSILARVAARDPERVRSLTLIEPTLFSLLEQFDRGAEHAEIKAVADRVVKYVGDGNPREAARGFIAYWVGDGAFDNMNTRVKDGIVDGMTKLALEWPEAFKPSGAELDRLAAINAPIQLLRGTKTTQAAREVVDLLATVWPDAVCIEIENAGHMSPVTHAALVNPHIENFIRNASSFS